MATGVDTSSNSRVRTRLTNKHPSVTLLLPGCLCCLLPTLNKHIYLKLLHLSQGPPRKKIYEHRKESKMKKTVLGSETVCCLCFLLFYISYYFL